MTEVLLLGDIAIGLLQLGVSVYILQRLQSQKVEVPPVTEPQGLYRLPTALPPNKAPIRLSGSGRELLRQRLATRLAERAAREQQ